MDGLRVGIIGAGRVGCALAMGLHKKGFDISGVSSRNNGTITFLRQSLACDFYTDIGQVVKEVDVIFITVPDSYIGETAARITKEAEGRFISGKTFFHCSGSLTSEELKDLEKLGGFTASLHPLQTFADMERGWRGLEGIYFGFEGCEEAEKAAGAITEALGSRLLTMGKDGKPIYHAAACIISNYVVALSQISKELLEEIGFNTEDANKAFSPLLRNTAGNIGELGPVKALTGPIARGDAVVVEKHLAAMKPLNPKFEKVYRTMGKIAVEIALTKGTIDEEGAEKLKRILEC